MYLGLLVNFFFSLSLSLKNIKNYEKNLNDTNDDYHYQDIKNFYYYYFMIFVCGNIQDINTSINHRGSLIIISYYLYYIAQSNTHIFIQRKSDRKSSNTELNQTKSQIESSSLSKVKTTIITQTNIINQSLINLKFIKVY